MKYCLKNKDTNYVHNKLYSTEKGALLGKRTLVNYELQKIYSNKKEDYKVYLYVVSNKEKRNISNLMIGIERPNDEAIRLFNQRKQELDERWEICQVLL